MRSGTKTILRSLWVVALLQPPANAFPPFQEFSEKHSGRPVNCAMCHVNDNGPTGSGAGQVDSLSKDELELLDKSRAQMEPGEGVDNPVLNKFGNEIVHKLGMTKVLGLMSEPGKLPEALGKESDLDGDGVSDGQEYLDGTDPLNKLNGDPIKLFFINLNLYKGAIALAVIAILLIDYGLVHLLKGMSARMEKELASSSSNE